MIYVSCFLLSTAFAWLASRAKDKTTAFVCSAVSVLVLCVLGGLRHETACWDVKVYAIHHYNDAIRSISLFDYMSKIDREWGWFLLTYLSAKIFGHLNWVLFIYQLVEISFFYIGAYKHRNMASLPFVWMIFCLMFYVHSYNNMRHGIAASIIFMGLDYLESKQYSKFSLYIIGAFFFHASAITCFPIFIGLHMLVTSKSITHNVMLKIFLALFMLVILANTLPLASLYVDAFSTAEKYRGYLDPRNGNYSRGMQAGNVLIRAAQFLILLMYYKRAKKVIPPIGGGGVDFHEFTLLIYVTYQIFVKLVSHRVLLYSEFAVMLSLAALPRCVKDKYLRFILFTSIILVTSFNWYRTIVIGNIANAYPYKSIL